MNVFNNIAIQKPKLEIININLCAIILFIIEKTIAPAVLPTNTKEPIKLISILLHSISYSLTQL